jgi:hypothetical protein
VNRPELDDRFAGDELDLGVWLPYYLPHWSSRAASAATYAVRDDELVLTIPPDQGLWCEDTHDGPLRVSCLQTGSFAGPLGSGAGQQPFRAGLVVRDGLHRFRDPSLTEEFSAERLPLDVADDHTYAVDWRPGSLTFVVDGEEVRHVGQAPDYPVQLMLGVFDFPAKADPDPLGPPPVPELVVSRVRGHPLG